MAAVSPSRDQNVANNTTNSTARNENSLALPPHQVEFIEKGIVVINSTELPPLSIRGIGLPDYALSSAIKVWYKTGI